MRNSLQSKTIEINSTKQNKNLNKLISYQKSKPIEQELKIAIINPEISLINNKTPVLTKSIESTPKKIFSNDIFLKQKPSDKFKISPSDPFSMGKKHKTNFGYVYSAGGIPCRILHGNVKLKLKWDIEPSSIEFEFYL